MATLVKLRGLERGDSVVGSGTVMSAGNRGFRVKSGLGKQSVTGAKASLTPTANTQTYTARYGGTQGNAYRVQTAVGSLAVTVTYTAGTGQPTILVTAPATATLAANQAVVAAVNAHAEASQYVVASIAGSGAAAHAAVAAANLTGGTDVSAVQNIYYNMNNRATIVVDIDDAETARTLKRNTNRFISLGAA